MKHQGHKWVTVFMVLAMLSLWTACAPVVAEPSLPATSTLFPMEITDQAGRVVKIAKIPQKIVSLAPSNTEIVYALGLEDRLVGVTEYDDYPEAAKSKPKIGGFSTVDIERVVAIQPDLILAANIHRDKVISELERLGLTVIAIDPHTVPEVMSAISLVGKATNKSEIASPLVKEISLFDVYQGEKVEAGYKSYAYSLLYQADDRTLQDEEVNRLHQELVSKVAPKLNARVR